MARIDKTLMPAKTTSNGAGAMKLEPPGERDPAQTAGKAGGPWANEVITPNGAPLVMFGGGLELPLEEFGKLLKNAQSAAWVAGQFQELEPTPPPRRKAELEQQVQELTKANKRLSETQAQLMTRIAALELEIAGDTTRLDQQVKELVVGRGSLVPKSG